MKNHGLIFFFPNVIAYAPYTIGAMHSIFSGVYGSKNGVNSYWSSPNFKKNLYKTLPKYLNEIGYVTIGDSINKLILPPDGFDELKIHDELHDNLTERHKTLLEQMATVKETGGEFIITHDVQHRAVLGLRSLEMLRAAFRSLV